MGRSVPTYRMTLDGLFAGWNGFRRALRKEDQEVFDALLVRARMHASASSYQAATDPVETVLLSILIEQEKELARQEKELAKQEKELARQEKELARQEKELARQERVLVNQERVLARQEEKLRRLEEGWKDGSLTSTPTTKRT